MSDNTGNSIYPRRVYPLSPRDLTEEQLAVVFAMTSRRPEAFDEISAQVTQEKAADFHERWVVGYGHASVAEHAIIHMAVENISRLACDSLEDNRLGSYTEKSSRYQVLPQGYFHIPAELGDRPAFEELYINSCNALFEAYGRIVDGTIEYLSSQNPQRDGERDSAYRLRLRRDATDSCRFVLPAATLTNVGVTMNARLLEHAISKLLSSELAEERDLGEELKEKGRQIAPTLVKYAEPSDYQVASRGSQAEMAGKLTSSGAASPDVSLVHHDPLAEQKVAAALLYRFSHQPYYQVWDRVRDMKDEELSELLNACLGRLGDHDAPPRELEMVEYTFELTLDYGAYREFKRHRMQTYIPQPLTVCNGFLTPDLIVRAGLEGDYSKIMGATSEAFDQVAEVSPTVAPYLVTHAHRRRVLAKMNLRQCYHLFKLRTQAQAHFSIREPMNRAMDLAMEVHPRLFSYLKLRA